jgi:hypothetical protein
MSNKTRRWMSAGLGLLMALAVFIPARIIDVISLRSQGVPLDINWPFGLVVLAVTLGTLLATSWPQRRRYGVLLAVALLTILWFIVLALKVNIDPGPVFVFGFIIFVPVNLIVAPITTLFAIRDSMGVIIYVVVGLMFVIVALLAAAVIQLLDIGLKSASRKRVIIVGSVIIIFISLGIWIGNSYKLEKNDIQTLIGFNQSLQNALDDQSGTLLLNQIGPIPNVRQQVSQHYTLDAGPGEGGTIINIYFDNGFVLGCIGHYTACIIGPRLYGLNIY